MQISTVIPAHVKAGGTTQTSESTTTSIETISTSPKALMERFNFEKMTVGEFADVISDMILSKRITMDQSLEITCTIIPPFPPDGATTEEIRAMPMNISYDALREDIFYAGKDHRLEDQAMFQRVFDFLTSLEGTPRRLDVRA